MRAPRPTASLGKGGISKRPKLPKPPSSISCAKPGADRTVKKASKIRYRGRITFPFPSQGPSQGRGLWLIQNQFIATGLHLEEMNTRESQERPLSRERAAELTSSEGSSSFFSCQTTRVMGSQMTEK